MAQPRGRRKSDKDTGNRPRRRDTGPAPLAPGAGGPGRLHFLRALLVGGIAAAVYLNTLSADFTLDDIPIIKENELITDLGNVPKFFTTNYWGENPKNPDKSLYRPLTILSYALNHAAHKLDPTGYHIVNVLLHAVASVLLYVFVAGAFEGARTAFIAAILFAVHPIHTEVVAGIVGRAEIMALIGTLACCIGYERATRPAMETPAPRAWAWLWLSVLGYGFGLFSKEIGIIAPAFIILFEALVPGRRALLRGRPRAIFAFVGFAAVAALFLFLRTQAIRSVTQNVGFVNVSTAERVMTALRVCLEYVILLIAPIRLSADYWVTDVPIARSITEPGVVLALAALAGMIVLIAYTWRRRPAIAWGIGAFLVALFPVSNIARPIGVMKAERLLYTPSAGFLLAAAALLTMLHGARRTRAAFWPVVGVIIVAFSARTWVRNRDWHDNRVLAAVTLKSSPDSVIFNTITATHYREAGDNANARVHLERALRQQPDNLTSLFNLGNIELDEKQFERAIDLYEKVLAREPNHISALNNMGRALSEIKRFDEAAVVLERSRALRPDNPASYVNLLSIYIQTRNLTVAVPVAEEALRKFPNVAAVHWNVGSVFRMAGRTEEGEKILDRARQLEGGQSVRDVRTSMD